MNQSIRAAVAIAAVANLVLAAGYAMQQPWALATWPWETGRLSHLFMASMLAAVGVAAAWIAVSGETGSMPAGFLNLAVTLGGIAAFVLASGQSAALGYGIAALALVNLGLLAWTLRWPQPEREPVPRLVRASYVLFTAILAVVGLLLILQTSGIMPWPLDPDTSVAFGWIFFGDAWYFAYAVVRPDWHSARAQLWSFLGYDLVLFGPLLLHFTGAPPELRDNVVVYLAILAYSGVLGIYYLLVNPKSRGWGHARADRHLSGAR